MAAVRGFREKVEEKTEEVFTNHGKRVARFPITTILLTFLLTGACMAGLLKFQLNKNFNDLWLPPHSVSLDLNNDVIL